MPKLTVFLEVKASGYDSLRLEAVELHPTRPIKSVGPVFEIELDLPEEMFRPKVKVTMQPMTIDTVAAAEQDTVDILKELRSM